MYSPKKEILLLTKVTAYPNTPTLCNLSKYEPLNDQDQVFFIQKGITLIFELENLFKVTAQPLPKDTLWVNYKPGWAKGRENILQTSGDFMNMISSCQYFIDYSL